MRGGRACALARVPAASRPGAAAGRAHLGGVVEVGKVVAAGASQRSVRNRPHWLATAGRGAPAAALSDIHVHIQGGQLVEAGGEHGSAAALPAAALLAAAHELLHHIPTGDGALCVAGVVGRWAPAVVSGRARHESSRRRVGVGTAARQANRAAVQKGDRQSTRPGSPRAAGPSQAHPPHHDCAEDAPNHAAPALLLLLAVLAVGARRRRGRRSSGWHPASPSCSTARLGCTGPACGKEGGPVGCPGRAKEPCAPCS